MNKLAKRSNILFLGLVLSHILAAIALALLELKGFTIDFVARIIISELTILVPALIYVLVANLDLGKWMVFKKIRLRDIVLIILLTYSLMPFITVVNLVSQLFVRNEVASSMFTEVVNLPPILAIFYIGILGPVCEELVFRGLIYQGYRKSGNIFGGMLLSGILFGILHLNFNQFCYATVLGCIFVLMYEATGSILAPIIAHIVVNTHNTVLMLQEVKMYKEMGIDIEEMVNTNVPNSLMLIFIGIFMVAGAAFTCLAVLLYIVILRNNGTTNHIKNIFITIAEQFKIRIISPSCIIGFALCLVYISGVFEKFITGIKIISLAENGFCR